MANLIQSAKAQVSQLTAQAYEAAVAAEALHDGLAGGQTAGRIPGTYIMHVFTTFIKELQNRFCMVSSGYPASAR